MQTLCVTMTEKGDDSYMTIGEKIEQLAKERGWSLHKLAALAGVPYSTVYSAVKRKSNRIDMNALERLAGVLGVSVSDLSGVEFELHDDGSSAAVVDIDKLNPMVVKMLTSTENTQGLQLGFYFKDENERREFEYLITNGDIPPEMIARLISAFLKLNYEGKRMLINQAETLAQCEVLLRIQDNTHAGMHSKE